MKITKNKSLSNKVNLTDGPILPALLTLAWPIVLSNLLQTAYNLADTFWVGQLGEEAVAALSLGFPIIFLFISLGSGLTIAGTALVAQNVGAENQEEANFLASQTLGFVGILSVGLSILGYYLCEPVVILLGAEAEVLPHAVTYLQTWFIGIPTVYVFFVFQSLVRGYGDTINPMKLMLVSTTLNIILDPFLIFGWGFFPAMGVQGAAVATISSRGLASLAGLYLLYSGKLGIQIDTSALWPRYQTAKKLLSIGVPAAAEQSMKALGITVMTGIVAAFGTSTLAAYGIGNRIASVVYLPSFGLAQATSSMVGQNLGARKEDRAERTVWTSSKIAFGVLAILSVGTFIWARPLSGIFLTPDDVQALNLSADYIRIQSLGFAFLGVLNIKNGAFRGAGRTVTAMVFGILSLLGLRVPLAFVLSHFTWLDTDGLWWAVAAANIIGGILATYWFSFGHWKQRLVEDDPPAKLLAPEENMPSAQPEPAGGISSTDDGDS